ncbi:aldehyde ferredoxin oxidoreductase family protein [Desulfobacula sp.]
MNSFWGKLLVVDLTKKKIETQTIPKKWVELYSGQKGLGTRILMEDFSPMTDPLSPENRMVLATSIMAGTIVSSSSKLAIVSKSPQTGTISDGSVGGHIGAELKYAGYDAVMITGKAASLSYLYIDPDKVEIQSVPELKGMGTFKADETLKEMIGDDQVKLLINGPAGENLVPFSCICSERYRQLGRGGMGAVMGSKNLKAIAVRGWLDVNVPDIKVCMEVAGHAHKKDGVTSSDNVISTDGTPVLVEYCQNSGLFPTRNFQEGTFKAYKNINSETFKEIRTQKKACFSCGIACGNYVKTRTNVVEGPEYETIAMGGACIGNSDPEKIVDFNVFCDDLGLDTISTGGVIAYMMEMTEKGIHDFGIQFGEMDKALKLTRQIAVRQGPGAEASTGVKALSEKFGGREFAIQVKGMELPGYDPRGSWGMGISYATAPRGGCHMSAYPIETEAWGETDPFTFKGKAQLVINLQNAQFAKFSMGVCDFWPIDSATLGRLFEVTFGGHWPAEKVKKTGERIFNLQRMFNVMADFDKTQDTLPARFHKEVLKDGPPKGIPMPKEAFDKALAEYYALRGWDSNGRPTKQKLMDLGIEDKFIRSYLKSMT